MQEHGIITSSVCGVFDIFYQCLIVFCIQVFVSLGRFIPKFFILFVWIVNGIVSFVSLPEFLLLMYKHEKDFCVLILYPATLLNSLISYNNYPAAP